MGAAAIREVDMNKEAATTGTTTNPPMQGQGVSEDRPSDGFTAWERDQIKRRAYALWKEAGCPQGQDRELWEQAELQILKGHPAA